MSMMLMVKAMQLKVGNPLRKLVLLKLADNASDTGECWPSHQHIADQCEMSKRSVINHINALVAMGLICVKRRIKNNEKQTNLYHLTLDHFNRLTGALPNAADSLGGAGASLPNVEDAQGSSARDAHRISHYSEPVKEAINEYKKDKINVLDELIQRGANKQHAQDYLKVRKDKRSVLTITAIKFIEREAIKAGITFADAIEICAQRGWQSFQSHYHWQGTISPKNNHDLSKMDYSQNQNKLSDFMKTPEELRAEGKL